MNVEVKKTHADLVRVTVDDGIDMGSMTLSADTWRQVLLTVSAQLERFDKQEPMQHYVDDSATGRWLRMCADESAA